MHDEFLPFSCSCPFWTLAQHCKGKQIPNLNSRPKPERKTVVLSCEVDQEENKRTVASEDIFPLHLDLKYQCWDSTRWVDFFDCIKFPWRRVRSRGKVQVDMLSASQEQHFRRRPWSPLADRSLDEVLCEIHVTGPAVIHEVGEQALQLPNPPF